MPKKRNAANPFGIAEAAPQPQPPNMQNPYAVPEEDDVAANEVAEENFNQGVRQNAMEYNAADRDGDNMLDFEEFCTLVREREQGDFTEQTLRKRFDMLDGDKSGLVDMREYIQFALRDALARSSTRVLDLFREWDDDGNGKISRKEFARAIRALGFNAPKEQLAILFDGINTSRSGSIEYAELNRMLRKQESIDPSLRPGAAGDIALEATIKTQLRRAHDGMKGSTLAKGVQLDPSSSTPMVEQLRNILFKNAVRIIDLFRDWDEDKNGLIDKKEFRRAMMALVDVGSYKRDVDRLFDAFDSDRSGSIEFAELNKTLRSGNNAVLAKELKAGAMGKIETESKNKSSIRTGGKASGPKIGLAARPPPKSARGGSAAQAAPRRAPPANRGAHSARGDLNSERAGSNGRRPSPRAGSTERDQRDQRDQREQREPPPQTRGHDPFPPQPSLMPPPPSGQPPSGRTSPPLDGWGFGGGGDLLTSTSQISQISEASRISRPQSRGGGGGGSVAGSVDRRALSSRGGARSEMGSLGGCRPRSELGMPSIHSNMRRAADVYLQAAAPSGPRRRPGGGRTPSPRMRGLPSLSEDRGGWAAGGGIGSKDELEAALAQAQTALVMAKERISLLEQQNAVLRAAKSGGGGGGGGGGGVGGGGVGVTKEKLQDASQLLADRVITAEDFAAIKAKYLHDQMGLA